MSKNCDVDKMDKRVKQWFNRWEEMEHRLNEKIHGEFTIRIPRTTLDLLLSYAIFLFLYFCDTLSLLFIPQKVLNHLR